MPDLTTVPMFVFYQGQPGDVDYERPIEVKYYNGSIELAQEGEFPVQERVSIHPAHVKALLKEIQKHLPEALHKLKQ